MTFKSITLRNFQRHRDLKVSLKPGLNVIVGPNSSGKSSVFRGFRAACLNRWRPGHLRHGKSYLRVVLEVDGQKVKAVRGKGKNSLSLGTKVYKATRTEVPPKVAALLNVGEENFQQQGDVHFWFNLSPNQVAVRLNEIVDLSLIDRSVSKAKSFATESTRRVEFTQERLNKAKTDERKLRWASRAARLLAELDALALARDQAGNRAKRLSEAIRERVRAGRQVKKLHRIVSAGRSAVKAGSTALETDRRCKRLLGALKSIASLEKDLNIRVPDLSGLDSVRKTADEIAERCRTLEYLIEDRELADKKVQQLTQEYRAAKTKRCPTCGRDLDPNPTRSGEKRS